MKKIYAGVFVLALFVGMFFGWPLLADLNDDFLPLGVDPDEPQILVTVEYMTYDQLLEPEVMDIAKRNNLLIAPVIRAHLLNEDLDRLYTEYKKAGIKIVFWPLLPREDCLYLNEEYADEYIEHLDRIYAWADKYGHDIEALIVDIEPPNCQEGTDEGPEEKEQQEGFALSQAFDLLGKEEFEASIPKFELVIDKLHEHNTVAISTAMDYAAMDIKTGRPVLQDVAGGPSLIVNWDYFSFMNFGSQNTVFLQELFEGMHMSWDVDDTRYLSYRLCKIIAKEYGNRAAISLGQTIPGEGHGAVWTDPADLGRDAAACKAAGIIHFGIYDFQGIVEADDPDAWVEAVRNAEPEKPKYSCKAVMVMNLVKTLSWYAQFKR